MPRPRKGIKKEDIGDPSNFRHVEGYGRKPVVPGKASHNSGSEQGHRTGLKSQVSFDQDDKPEEEYPVERRNKVRPTMIPRHHRSTTTCIFPADSGKQKNAGEPRPSLLGRQDSVDSSDIKSSLSKPTFGSLLNLSFLPLGLGKSSSKSPSIGKTKRMSLLNLTATGLFANQKHEEKRESVHMTSYVRRRSSSNEENDDNLPASSLQPVVDKGNTVSIQTLPKKPISARPTLAKLGRSKSSMSEFTKRPKLRLILPPTSPPPTPPVESFAKQFEPEETLPSPPPSPLPSPPPSPVALRPSPKTVPRPRIIPLPSTSSVDSVDPGSSPQYLTPAGGSSPQPEPVFPVMSPTLPPSCTPFFSQDNPATPPVWPLQPLWPSQVSMLRKDLEATIPELPSPSKEEMETENEYSPVMSIVDSFISNGQENPEKSLTLTSINIPAISSVLHENLAFEQMLRLSEKMFRSVSNESSLTPCQMDIYKSIWDKTLEFWVARCGEDAAADKLIDILRQENHHQATDALLGILKDLQM